MRLRRPADRSRRPALRWPDGRAHPFDSNMPERINTTEASERIQDLDSDEATVRIVVRGDPLGKVLRRDGRIAESDAKRVYLGVVANGHG